MFDLDYLKKINDSYGHKWGDVYILKAVEALKTMSDNDHLLLARRSGDEFIVLLHGFDSKAAIRKCLDDFYLNINTNNIQFPDQSLKSISISGGLLWLEHDYLTYDELLHFADEALYEAKNKYKGFWVENTNL
jgi:diguanylate cyclase (GGDEF)-like protein